MAEKEYKLNVFFTNKKTFNCYPTNVPKCWREYGISILLQWFSGVPAITVSIFIQIYDLNPLFLKNNLFKLFITLHKVNQRSLQAIPIKPWLKKEKWADYNQIANKASSELTCIHIFPRCNRFLLVQRWCFSFLKSITKNMASLAKHCFVFGY